MNDKSPGWVRVIYLHHVVGQGELRQDDSQSLNIDGHVSLDTLGGETIVTRTHTQAELVQSCRLISY